MGLAVSLLAVLAGGAQPVRAATAVVQGALAGAFDYSMWTAGSAGGVTHGLNFVNDVRWPLINPLAGNYRNIYAPTVVQTDTGWRVFYGGWDGIPTGHDCLYSAQTSDFVTLTDRHMEVSNGEFWHVCNPSAVQTGDGTFHVMATSAMTGSGSLNKPVHFSSSDGQTWNDYPTVPYPADTDDLITMTGYVDFAGADINGMNVITYEGGVYHLYFNDFKRMGKTYHATSSDCQSFQYQGIVQTANLIVNDVKKLTVNGQNYYLMGQHLNTDTLWYSLSASAWTFGAPKVLSYNQTAADKYITSIGWVTDEDRVLGYLYGAGASSTLAYNRIFARWLQKEVRFVCDDGFTLTASGALGPDQQIFDIPLDVILSGHFELYNENGSELLWTSDQVELTAGQTYYVRGAPPHLGDANNDGTVDVGDLGILALNWGGTGKDWSTGDFTDNGTVDVGDLGVLAANWGWTDTPASSGVPEPATAWMLTIAAAAMWRRLRRRRPV